MVKKKTKKKKPWHEELGVPKAGRWGKHYSVGRKKHDWPVIIDRISREVTAAPTLAEARKRKAQLVQAHNFAGMFSDRAHMRAMKVPGSADPAALAIDMREVDRRYERAYRLADRYIEELERKEAKKPSGMSRIRLKTRAKLKREHAAGMKRKKKKK